MFNKNIQFISKKPFTLFKINNFFSTDFYKRLENNYPNLENLNIGNLDTEYEIICKCMAQKTALKIIHKSPDCILLKLIVSPDELSKSDPVKQIIILGNTDQCIDLNRKRPIIGTIKI